MKFESLALCEPLLRGLEAAGYRLATPIQQRAIPKLLTGRDLIGCAQTGTGKTAAFTLPTLQRLMESSPAGARSRRRPGRPAIRALVLTPTRELAAQIGDSLTTYGKFSGIRHTVVFGGVRQGPQVRALEAGIDVLVATPGRLLDLTGQGFVDYSSVEILILDEADRMLDMGFIHDLRKIVARVPERRQTLMFSATMPPEVRELAKLWLRRHSEIKVTPVASTPQLVSQTVCFVPRQDKSRMLVGILREIRGAKTLVFSRTKHGADRIARVLKREGIPAVSIHGNKSQANRQATMRQFDSPSPPVLVATDLAARGLDFRDVSHVINYDLPEVPETYVHRIGRTARAGASGKAISLCDEAERQHLRLIEKLTGQAVPVEQRPVMSDGSSSRAVAANGFGQRDASISAAPKPPKNGGGAPSGAARRSRRRRRRSSFTSGGRGSDDPHASVPR